MRAKGEQGEEFQLPTRSFTTWFQPSGAKSQVRPTSSSSQEGESIFQGDDYESSPEEDASAGADNRALEAASCVVNVSPGDAVVLFPDLFHRTQDYAVWRLSLLAEAV